MYGLLEGNVLLLTVMITRKIPEGFLFSVGLPSSRYDLTYPFSLPAVSPHLLRIPVCMFSKAFDADWN